MYLFAQHNKISLPKMTDKIMFNTVLYKTLLQMHIMTDISQMFLYLHYLFISQQQSTEFHATNTSSETKC